ncbi:MAG: molybdopterin adenylyltransferase [Planctomycetota bacterium]
MGRPGSAGSSGISTAATQAEPSEAQAVTIGIVTVSDRASRGEYEDLGGPAVAAFLDEALTTPYTAMRAVVADEREQLRSILVRMCDRDHCCLILTTGGTGPAERDITPDVTEEVAPKLLPGFGEEMRRVSLQYVPTAILSRQLAAIRGQTLIINLPGRPKSIRECLTAIFAAVPYCIDLIGGPTLDTNPSVIKAFRPERK